MGVLSAIKNKSIFRGGEQVNCFTITLTNTCSDHLTRPGVFKETVS